MLLSLQLSAQKAGKLCGPSGGNGGGSLEARWSWLRGTRGMADRGWMELSPVGRCGTGPLLAVPWGSRSRAWLPHGSCSPALLGHMQMSAGVPCATCTELPRGCGRENNILWHWVVCKNHSVKPAYFTEVFFFFYTPLNTLIQRELCFWGMLSVLNGHPLTLRLTKN